MSLNNIQLNPHLVADLYRESLVEVEIIQREKKKEEQEQKQEEQEVTWKYLGEFQKNILLIVNYPAVTYLPDEELNFLTTILTACKLGLKDVAILNTAHSPSGEYKDVIAKFKSKVIILFGLTPEQFSMPMNFPAFQVQTFNQCTFLHNPTLEELEADKVLKSKCWVSLRRIFEV